MSGTAENEPLRRLVHDLRTPLTVVAGFAELLQARQETISPEDRRECLRRLTEGADELRAILDAARGEPSPGEQRS